MSAIPEVRWVRTPYERAGAWLRHRNEDWDYTRRLARADERELRAGIEYAASVGVPEQDIADTIGQSRHYVRKQLGRA